ncbi:uncharacterized protein FIBRA_01105 [Fibroporia radiculosa]|uniref:VanZ-like domain-containing protein n=1 Tax=Fibroporia radiculosa TaxID=599839 RepID=J4I8A9_9APHY|nr:uncharacterized protein FIBRA_01105 [Fibroporia radiculosa]CCL99091.1 predicted protein [Fibroporia radiculosa]
MSELTIGASSDSVWTRTSRNLRRHIRRSNKAIMRSHRIHLPMYDMPIRLRPWFILFTLLIMLVLGFLGFTNFSHELPLNDKFIHFSCLCIATAVFYFIFDVEDDARRIWFWRSSPLIFTGITCFFLGGIISEFVQSMLPYKEFQIGDVAANLLGSSIGLYVSYHLERYYRHRREILRLYQPLNEDVILSDDDDDDAMQLLPSHYIPHSPRNTQKGANAKTGAGMVRLGDVWDEGEEIFGLGDESDEEESHSHSAGLPALGLGTPKIIVTDTETQSPFHSAG